MVERGRLSSHWLLWWRARLRGSARPPRPPRRLKGGLDWAGRLGGPVGACRREHHRELGAARGTPGVPVLPRASERARERESKDGVLSARSSASCARGEEPAASTFRTADRMPIQQARNPFRRCHPEPGPATQPGPDSQARRHRARGRRRRRAAGGPAARGPPQPPSRPALDRGITDSTSGSIQWRSGCEPAARVQLGGWSSRGAKQA